MALCSRFQGAAHHYQAANPGFSDGGDLMQQLPAYIDPAGVIFPIYYCQFAPCISETGICTCYEGMAASGEAILCGLGNTGGA